MTYNIFSNRCLWKHHVETQMWNTLSIKEQNLDMWRISADGNMHEKNTAKQCLLNKLKKFKKIIWF